MLRANGASAGAPGRSRTSVCSSSTSKMRSAAAIACCRLAFTRLSFLTGPYISSSAATNDVNSPGVSRPAAIARLPYQSATAMAMPPSSSISGGRIDTIRVTVMFVRYSRCDAASNFCRLALLRA